VGGVKNGKKHGLGTYTWANGDKYAGEWKNDRRQGQGTYTWDDGTTKTGIWVNQECIEKFSLRSTKYLKPNKPKSNITNH